MKPEEKIADCLAMRQNLEAIINSIYDGLLVLDNDLRVTNINNSALSFFGVTRDEVMGKTCFCDDQLSEIKDIIYSSLTTKKEFKNFSVEMKGGLGEVRTVIISSALLQEKANMSGGIVIIIHDISQIRDLQKKYESQSGFSSLIGSNETMRELYALMSKVADSDAEVLIEGESGTGKGLIAQAIHSKSSRRDRNFVTVNCSALSETLLESELFGHAKGSFTGAIKERIGRFEFADGGTIFLDEVGEISPSIQVKLLNVLQEKKIERVGESEPRGVDVRLISATNKSLKELVSQNLFREDLYYRLKVVRLVAPPLRDRLDDLPALIDHFMELQRKKSGKKIVKISDQSMHILSRYRWPGNVRELANAISLAFVLSDSDTIEPEDLPEDVTQKPIRPDYRRSEYDHIITALDRNGGSKSATAKELGIDRTTLWRKMKSYDIR